MAQCASVNFHESQRSIFKALICRVNYGLFSNITFNVDHEEAAALLHFLRRVPHSDVERTLGSLAEVIQFNAGCDALRLALTDALGMK